MNIKCQKGVVLMERTIKCCIGNSFLISSDDQEKVFFLGAERQSTGVWSITLLFERNININFDNKPEAATMPFYNQILQNKVKIQVEEGERIEFSTHLGNKLDVIEKGIFFSNTVKRFVGINEVVFNKISSYQLELTCHYLSLEHQVNDSLRITSHVC